MKKIHISKDSYLIAYKLLHDALLLEIVTFASMLVAEGLIPGFISSHVSLAKVAVGLIVTVGAITWIGKIFDISYPAPTISKNRLVPPLVLFAFLLIGNSMLKFSLWQNFVITLSALLVFLLFYKLIFEDERR